MARGIPKSVLDMLRKVPLFSGCNQKELQEIANIGTELSVREGSTLTEQGQPGREFFLLVDGKARCLIDGAEVARFGPGDFFGEMALLEHGPRHATVITEGPTEVLVLDSREFSRLLDTAPSIARKLLAELAQRERAGTDLRR
ncbi:MAG TPA: cyclic nucleotide-binding domain-containing protein [Acidimicrobiales bacterium]|nr:cyclic nucleotide-binding domain-containing protein [Acidimicrobiales bacterium]